MKRRPKKQDLIDWRRSYVVEQISKGRTQAEIARNLQVGIGTVNRDIDWFKHNIKEKMEKLIEKIQEEHEKSMVGLKAVLKEAWFMIENAEDNKEKLAALSLAKDCYALQEELICNLPIIDEALKLGSELQESTTKGRQALEEKGIEEDQALKQAVVKEGLDVVNREGDVAGREKRVREGVDCACTRKGEKDDIQGSEEKGRENQESETTNTTF